MNEKTPIISINLSALEPSETTTACSHDEKADPQWVEEYAASGNGGKDDNVLR